MQRLSQLIISSKGDFLTGIDGQQSTSIHQWVLHVIVVNETLASSVIIFMFPDQRVGCLASLH